MRLAVKTQPIRVAATAMERFPNNVACNFPVNLSCIEIWVLQFQRLRACRKVRVAELHAKCGGKRPTVTIGGDR